MRIRFTRKAKYPGRCCVCGGQIRVGQEIEIGSVAAMGARSTAHVHCPHDIGRQAAVEDLIAMTGIKREVKP